MSDTPQRPFVPHRTPTASPQIALNSDFLVAKPFVPTEGSLPSIAEFLDAPREELFDDLPPVEHFIDPLPEVTAFAPETADAQADVDEGESVYAAESSPATEEATGWIQDDWQRYDWRAAAALGDAPESEASTEWAKTDWEVSPPLTREQKPTAAEAIASALDQIAQRIRQGELAVPSPETLTNPAAIAASLAALLGVKR